MAAEGSAGEGNRDLPSEWTSALELLQEDLRRRDAAARTRRAYAVDLDQFARWAHARGRMPRDVDVRDVRRYVAGLSEGGAAPASTARKLAAIRGLFSSQREHGLVGGNPADLVATPRQPSRLPRVLKASEAARLLESVPGGTPLELRDRALFELRVRLRSAGGGARIAGSRRRGLGRRAAADRRQGPQDALRPGRGAGDGGAA